MDKPLINYKDYKDECLAMRMKAFNELLECRNCIVSGVKDIVLFLGDYAFQEMKEDGADYL